MGLLNLLQTYLTGIRGGGSRNVAAKCPFHRKLGQLENTPSFSMNLDTGLFFCFSCGEKGNLRTFLHKMQVPPDLIEREYKYLIEELGKNAKQKLDPHKPAHVICDDPIPEALLGLFEFVPVELEKQGFDEALLAYFDVGFDEAHMRITYPIRDILGNLTAISGRTVVDTYPRYKIYDREYTQWGLPVRQTIKGSLLWNANRVYAQNYFKYAPDPVIMVEGFKAAMRVHQYGYPNVIALLGSTMTEAQQWIVERLGAPVYILLDYDAAGQSKVEIIARRLAKSLPVFVCSYPEGIAHGTQPDSLTREQLNSMLAHAEDFYLWALTRRKKANHDRLPA